MLGKCSLNPCVARTFEVGRNLAVYIPVLLEPYIKRFHKVPLKSIKEFVIDTQLIHLKKSNDHFS